MLADGVISVKKKKKDSAKKAEDVFFFHMVDNPAESRTFGGKITLLRIRPCGAVGNEHRGSYERVGKTLLGFCEGC